MRGNACALAGPPLQSFLFLFCHWGTHAYHTPPNPRPLFNSAAARSHFFGKRGSSRSVGVCPARRAVCHCQKHTRRRRRWWFVEFFWCGWRRQTHIFRQSFALYFSASKQGARDCLVVACCGGESVQCARTYTHKQTARARKCGDVRWNTLCACCSFATFFLPLAPHQTRLPQNQNQPIFVRHKHRERVKPFQGKKVMLSRASSHAPLHAPPRRNSQVLRKWQVLQCCTLCLFVSSPAAAAAATIESDWLK